MSSRSLQVRRRITVGLIAIALSLSAACSQAAAGMAPVVPSSASAARAATSSPAPNPTTGSAATSVTYPLSVTNCGRQVTLNARPKRILAIKSTALESLLALGVGDRVIGSAFLDGPVPSQWTAAAARIPVMSKQAPSQEPVLALHPDLIVAGWESNLAADTAGTPATLAAKGIAGYVDPSACKEPAARPAKLSFPIVFGEIAQLGTVVDAQPAAAKLIAQQRQQLATIKKAKPGTTAVWWSSGTDTPYVGAAAGAPEMVMEAAGLTNIAVGINDTWTSLGWESIITANPDVIVLVDAAWNPAKKKIARLEANPVTSKLNAVVHHRYVVIPFAASEAGVRSVSAAATLSQALGTWGLLR